VVEEDLTREPDVFFEAGDHEHLVHVAQADFARLLGDAPRVHFARHV
jgi:Ala-tRNA(Pro) deacylase